MATSGGLPVELCAYDSTTEFSYSTAADKYAGPRASIFSEKKPVDLP